LAKEHGYRSRAAFKLVQLNKKFNFLEKANVLIDLCAAPGSWCQVAAKFMPASKTIIGVDLDAIKPIPNVITFVNDITTQSCRQEIKKLIKNAKAEVVLHDGAPNVGTAWTHDAYMQAELTLSACRLATEFLAPNGTFVTKVFRSAEYTKLLWVFHQLFSRVTATKPQASRNVSAEIFVVCEGFLAPKKIDPKLLDPKHVLTSIEQKAYAYSVFAKKASRHRTGYEDDAGVVLHKKVSVKEFVKTDDPIKLLSSCNAFHFEDADCKRYLESPLLTEELKICFSDLKVLGKRDFKALLKWRSAMRAQDAEAAAALESSEDDEEVVMTKEEEDAKLLQEMDDHMREVARKEKKKKKKQKEEREKTKRRMALTLDVGDEFDDPGAQDALFNLKRVNKKLATDVAPDAVVVPSEDEASGSEEEEDDDAWISDDERQRRYEAQLEERMDVMYTKYLLQTRKNKKRVLDALHREGLDDDAQDGDGGVLDLGSDEEFEMDAASKLIVKDVEDSSARAKLWFDEPMFSGILENTTDETAEMQRRLKTIIEAQKAKHAAEAADASSDSDDDADDESGDSDYESDGFEVVPTPANDGDSDLDVPSPKRKKDKKGSNGNGDAVHVVDVKKMNAEKEKEIKKAQEAKNKKAALEALKKSGRQGSSEKKPVAKDRVALDKLKAKKRANGMDVDGEESEGSSEDSVDSSFEEVENNAVAKANENDTDYDTDEKAEIMAMAARLKDPKVRSYMTDHAYSKHSFTTSEELPRWFNDDEKTNNRPLVPISRAEFQEYRDQLKAIDSRASHRVAEAQARKKKRMARAMEKAKAKAGKILEAEDIPDSAKKRELERIFSKAKATFKPTKTYVVGGQRLEHSKKTGKGSVSFTRHVDTRLKKDKRAAKAQERKRKRK
jgi:AdoMet-dependent rRNA methyltransferase SPB1